MTIFKRLPSAGIAALFLGAIAIGGGPAAADQVFNDDVIIEGSLCVGFDCASGMNFGFDTIVLQENNLRIFFNDTSTSGWISEQRLAPDRQRPTSGGASFFCD